MVCYESENRLEIVRGTTNAFGISVKNAEGEKLVLESEQSLVFGLKRHEFDQDRVLVKKFSGSTDSGYYLELKPEDTADLQPGQYYYDIGLQQGASVFYNVVELSPFLIKANATRLGDGA